MPSALLKSARKGPESPSNLFRYLRPFISFVAAKVGARRRRALADLLQQRPITGRSGNPDLGHRFCITVSLSFATPGGFQEPFRIEGDSSFGQYIRNIGMNAPFGAGSQLASLSEPGDTFWK